MRQPIIVAAAIILAACVFLSGCRTPSARIAIIPLQYPGFQTYPTPRTFDGPGTLFRIDETGKKFPTANLSVTVTNVGQESFSTVNLNKPWEVSVLAKFLGKTDTSIGSSSKWHLTLDADLGPGTRFRTYDKDVDEAIEAAGIKYKEGNHYYVVRETVAFRRIDFTLSQSNAVTAEAKGMLKRVADLSGKVVRISSSETKLTQDWDSLHHAFFTVDEIIPPGKGLFGSKPKRLPLKKPLVITGEQVR